MNQKANLQDYFLNRRTIRKYSQQEVPEELIDRLLLLASHAPTTGNMQLYSAVVSRTPEEKQLLAPCHFNQTQVEGASAVITFCADFHRFSVWCEERNAEPCYDNLQSFMAAALDTIAFAQQFNTLAEMNGLGVCWLGTTTYNAREIAGILRLPRLVVPLITLTVGYPAEEGTDVGRLPLDAIVHRGHYNDYTGADINRLYEEKESREDSRNFVMENGKETLAQVFTDIRYPRANNELFSEKFMDFLSESGFLPEKG